MHCLEVNSNLKAKENEEDFEYVYTHRKLKRFETEFIKAKAGNNDGFSNQRSFIAFKPFEMKCLKIKIS